jgi:hypothetical protein
MKEWFSRSRGEHTRQLTVEGFTPGSPLILNGEFTDSLFETIPIGPTDVAVVGTPEPVTAVLFSLGLLGLAALRRGAASGHLIAGRVT